MLEDYSHYAIPICLAIDFAIVGFAMSYYGDDSIQGFQLSYVQPDSSTFSIWSIIYTLHVTLAIYQFLPKYRSCERLEAARPWLCAQYVTNGLWLVAAGSANRGLSQWLSVVVIVTNALCLLKAYNLLHINYSPSLSLSCVFRTTWKRRVFLYLAISLNLSWVTLASILNFSNTVYDPSRDALTQIGGADWAIGVLALAGVLSSYLVVTRRDVGFALVVVWASMGIYRQQTDGGDSEYKENMRKRGKIVSPPSQTLADFAQWIAIGVGILCILSLALSFISFLKPSNSHSITHVNAGVREEGKGGKMNDSIAFSDVHSRYRYCRCCVCEGCAKEENRLKGSVVSASREEKVTVSDMTGM